MTNFECISLTVDDAIATVTLRQPQKLNALTDEMMTELSSALDIVAADGDVRVIILTGEGRAFSAGYDISPRPIPRSAVQDWRAHFRIGVGAMRKIWDCPKPVVAKVRGACVGGGFDLMFACDLTVATEDSFFGEPEVKFGGGSMFMLLPWLVGIRHVNELLLTGDTVDAGRAYELGLINKVVSADRLDSYVAELARGMTLVPSGTLTKNKATIHRVYEIMGVTEAFRVGEDIAALTLSSREGESLEFDRIAAEQGLKSALAWRTARFSLEGNGRGHS